MHLTKESEYALRGLVALAAAEGEFKALGRIADSEDLPGPFLAKTFQKLTRLGLLIAARGPGSGYALARSPDDISLREILECVEGPELFSCCMLWQGYAEHDRCPLHDYLAPIRISLAARMESISLAQYAATQLARHASPSSEGLPT